VSGWELPEWIIEPRPCEHCGGELWTGVTGLEPDGWTPRQAVEPLRLMVAGDVEAKVKLPIEKTRDRIGYHLWCPRCEKLETGGFRTWRMDARNRSGDWWSWQRPGVHATAYQMRAFMEGMKHLVNDLDSIRQARAVNGREPWALERRGESVWIPYFKHSLHRHGDPVRLRRSKIQSAAKHCYSCDFLVEEGVCWRPETPESWWKCAWPREHLESIIVCNACWLGTREPEGTKVVDAGPRRVVVIDGGRGQ
jgi:hypothetical protein